MKFVKLTHANGDTVWVNLDKASAITQIKDGSYILFDDHQSFVVAESAEDIMFDVGYRLPRGRSVPSNLGA